MVCFALVLWFVFLWFCGLFSSGFIVCFALVFLFSIQRVSFGISTWGAGYYISTAYPRGGDDISLRRTCSVPDEADPLTVFFSACLCLIETVGETQKSLVAKTLLFLPPGNVTFCSFC